VVCLEGIMKAAAATLLFDLFAKDHQETVNSGQLQLDIFVKLAALPYNRLQSLILTP